VSLTRGERVAAFMERYLIVPSGDLIGEPMRLEPFQRKFLLEVYDNPYGTRRAYLSIARKNGKGLALDTPIPTPSGWRSMGSLRPGDVLFDEAGAPCQVEFVSPVHVGLKCWRLSFSDGSAIVADEQHSWHTTHRFRPWATRRVNGSGNGGRRFTEIVTTPEIAGSVMIRRSDGGAEFNHSIWVSGALRTNDTQLPLDPYLLGCWLTCGDLDIEHFRRAVGDGLNCNPVVRRDRTAWHLGFTAGSGGTKAGKFHAILRRLGLLGNKHIPDAYLWSGTEQRRALLQGLMDTDGTITPTGTSGATSCDFTGTNLNLCRGVLTLVRSMGIKATLTRRDAKIYGRLIGDAFRVQFTAWKDDAVFRLERKAQRLLPRPARATRSATLKIVSCEPVESVPTVCISVSSPSRLFLAGHGMTATHNTATIAGIVLAHLVGPEARQNTQIISGAQSREQAAVVFDLAHKMVQMSPALSRLVRAVPSHKQLTGLARNVEYRAIAAEGKTAFGLSPVVAVLDEVGQIQGPRDRFVTAITTSQGAYENALMIAISTQAPTDADMFSLWIDTQKNTADPRIVCHVYEAPKDCALDDRSAWFAANPALGKFKSLGSVEHMSKLAMDMPTNEPEFRNLDLNQRVEASSPFVPRSVWELNGADPGPLDGAKVYGGLDLSAVRDLTALELVDEHGGVHSTFWLPEYGLAQKSKDDHVPYDIWKKQGFLNTTPGKAIEYEFVAEFLRGVFDRCDVQSIGFDRYNIKFLKPWLEKAGFSEEELAKFVEFGQGTASMTPALRELEVRLSNGQLKHGNHPILNMCSDNAVVVGDSGARKFDKARSRGRIDGMVALAMAVGVMPSAVEEASYQVFIA
jgi:phage terminase large subunit-like protein